MDCRAQVPQYCFPLFPDLPLVIETPDYLVDAKALGLTADERRSIVDCIAQTPDAGEDIPVFLLSIFSKGERANLSQAERNEMKKILISLSDVYKKGVKIDLKHKNGNPNKT